MRFKVIWGIWGGIWIDWKRTLEQKDSNCEKWWAELNSDRQNYREIEKFNHIIIYQILTQWSGDERNLCEDLQGTNEQQEASQSHHSFDMSPCDILYSLSWKFTSKKSFWDTRTLSNQLRKFSLPFTAILGGIEKSLLTLQVFWGITLKDAMRDCNFNWIKTIKGVF